MLRLYPIALDWLKAVRPLIAQIARYDRDLAKRLRRSSSSVILNLGEGMYSRGGHRTNAHGVALREMGESYSALQAAQVNGYVAALDPAFEALEGERGPRPWVGSFRRGVSESQTVANTSGVFVRDRLRCANPPGRAGAAAESLRRPLSVENF